MAKEYNSSLGDLSGDKAKLFRRQILNIYAIGYVMGEAARKVYVNLPEKLKYDIRCSIEIGIKCNKCNE